VYRGKTVPAPEVFEDPVDSLRELPGLTPENENGI
jgi:hypothetical protein